MFDAGTKLFQSILNPLDYLFDKIYGSKYNPLYRSGTLAVALLLIVIFTGVLLLFFYRLSAPFESIADMGQQVFLGRWLRTLHRYTSDLLVVVVVFHVFRMMTEGKTWGPRSLAWLTGVFLFLMILVVGWTGFVLVWDQHGQALAVTGAQMMNSIPLFSGVLTRSVSGATSISSSFFFLNLFLHMSLPLGMIFILWLHTSKLNRPAWLFEKKIFVFLLISTILVSILFPAPVGEMADLLSLNENYRINLYYGFVIALANAGSPGGAFLLMIGFFSLMLLIPLCWRPQNKPKVSIHNQSACTGCGQCSLDCPFGAIEMVPRTEGVGSETVAFVDASACVGCGICTASCSQMAIGPEDKSSRLQMQKIKNLKALDPSGGQLYIYCRQNPLGKKYFSRRKRERPEAVSYEIDCTGNLHVASVSFALGHFKGVSVVGCPQHACVNRLGQEWLEERFLNKRDPAAPARMDFSRVQIFSGSLADLDQLEEESSVFLKPAQKIPSWFADGGSKKWGRFLKSLLGTLVLLSIVAFLSAIPYQNPLTYSVLRIAIRLPGQVSEVCRERRTEELTALPQHMRNAKDCTRKALDYQLTVKIDGLKKWEKIVSAHGVRGDKPLSVEKDLSLPPGVHDVSVQFVPLEDLNSTALNLTEQFSAEFVQGRALLVSYNANTKTLFHSKQAVK